MRDEKDQVLLIQAKLEEVGFGLGDLVELHSLRATALNGLRGRVWGLQGARLQVELGAPHDGKAFKPDNLTKVVEDPHGAGRAAADCPDSEGSTPSSEAKHHMLLPSTPSTATATPGCLELAAVTLEIVGAKFEYQLFEDDESASVSGMSGMLKSSRVVTPLWCSSAGRPMPRPRSLI